jgi:hydrogenase maturation protease
MKAEQSILVAGMGNIFLGDDAFGVEVVRALPTRNLPQQILVADFGIRAYDLAYALAEPYQAIILVDAVPRGDLPGTLYLIEPDLQAISSLGLQAPDAHSLDPIKVLQMAQTLGGITARLFLIGCEPAAWDSQNGAMELSESVRASIPRALDLIQSLVRRLLNLESRTTAGAVPV